MLRQLERTARQDRCGTGRISNHRPQVVHLQQDSHASAIEGERLDPLNSAVVPWAFPGALAAWVLRGAAALLSHVRSESEMCKGL